jgi:hypothetical protein
MGVGGDRLVDESTAMCWSPPLREVSAGCYGGEWDGASAGKNGAPTSAWVDDGSLYESFFG